MTSARQGRVIRVLLGSLVAACLGTEPAVAQDPEDKLAVYLDVEGACPDRDTVEKELTPLLDRWGFAPSADAGQETVRVVDRGDSVEISAVGDVREVSDPNGDCRERARVAAVFIALRLEPAVGPTDEEPPGDEPSQKSEPAEVRRSSELVRVEVGVGGLANKSLDARLGWTVGPLVSLAVERRAMLAYFSASLQTSTETEAEEVRLRFARMPFDLGLGYSLAHGHLSWTPLVSLAVDSLRVTAPELPGARPHGRLEVGPRFALRVARTFGAAHLFGVARLSWFPRNYFVEVHPVGEVMRTPRFLLGASVGLSFDLHR